MKKINFIDSFIGKNYIRKKLRDCTMNNRLIPLLIFITLVFEFSLYAQVKYSGSYMGSAYVYENINAETRGDYYHNFQFRIAPENYTNLHLNSYFRFARRGDPAKWGDKLFNTYLHWAPRNKPVYFRAGRQFFYNGVINTTADAFLISVIPSRKLIIKAMGGMAAPYSREFKVQSWDEGGLFGGYLSYRFSELIKADLSYFDRQRDSEKIWQLMGAALSGIFVPQFYYQLQFDYNFKTKSYQGIRGRLSYYYDKWVFSGEYNDQKPRIYEDSYFRIFDVRAYRQFRGMVTYELSIVQVGLQYLYTAYEEDNTNQLIFTIGKNWGHIGLLYQNGFGGDNFGLFGNVLWEFVPTLTAKLYASYYNYQFHTTEITDDATAFSAGLIYQPITLLALHGELQQSINKIYKNDVRGLFRIHLFLRN